MHAPPPPMLLWLAGQVVRRPAVPVAGLLIAGIAVHTYLPAHLPFWLTTITACAMAAWAWRQSAGLASAFLSAGVFVAGIALAQVEKYRFPSHHIAHFARDEPRLAQLELYLEHPPRVLSDQFAIGRALPPRQVCVARVTRVKTWDGWIDATGAILVQIDQPHPRLDVDQTVRVTGMLQRPSVAMNPGQFNWADYYREQRVLCSIGVDQTENVRIVARGASGPITSLRQQARRLLAAGFDQSASLDHALLRALLLGDHDPELRDVQEQFRRTGTSHHLAISGLHVAVLGAVVHLLCRLLQAPPRVSAWVAIGFVVVYGLAALPSPPVVRSVLLCTAFAVGLLWWRSVDAVQLLALSVIAMLVYHPLDLFNAGFQLSAGTVLGLILFTDRLSTRLFPQDIDTAVLRSFHHLSRRQLMMGHLRRLGAGTLAASIVAWVVSSPLIAFHFQQLNPWAIPGSILLAPFVFVALVGGFLKVLFTLAWPSAAGVWAKLATLPMEAMRDTVDLLARLPGADVPLPAPPAWAVVLFYLALTFPLLPTASRLARRGIRACCSAAGVGAVLTPILLGGRSIDPVQPRAEELSLTLLAIGAGQCAVIAPPRGPLVLIDCGSATLRDPLRRCIAPFVRHLGRWSVDRVILSHSDFDHISAAAEIVQAYG
ncbi:MAG: ComEC/Rec2 family competence protein, partial [Phycisphaerae bacterium]|nr:ComEC/Rec2 family competence protein [Phycisphaerae bacterium]